MAPYLQGSCGLAGMDVIRLPCNVIAAWARTRRQSSTFMKKWDWLYCFFVSNLLFNTHGSPVSLFSRSILITAPLVALAMTLTVLSGIISKLNGKQFSRKTWTGTLLRYACLRIQALQNSVDPAKWSTEIARSLTRANIIDCMEIEMGVEEYEQLVRFATSPFELVIYFRNSRL